MQSEPLSRRDLLRAGLCLFSCHMLSACDGNGSEPTSPGLEFADDAATVRGSTVEIDVSRVPQWRNAPAAETAVVFLAAQVIVVRRTASSFTALSAVCPHAGCGVSRVQTNALVCPCHDSTFTFNGERVSGPAPTGLAPLPVRFEQRDGRLFVDLR